MHRKPLMMRRWLSISVETRVRCKREPAEGLILVSQARMNGSAIVGATQLLADNSCKWIDDFQRLGSSGYLSVQDKGPPKRTARTSGPFLRFPGSYFGSGSDAKFAWTITHLSPFFTNTRVDFARLGVVLPSLSMVVPA